MVVYQDNKPNNQESPYQLYIQYSQDINFDYKNGKFPSGKELDFVWEDNYVPIKHYVNNRLVGSHVWRREKIGIDGEWTAPQLISIKDDIKEILKLEIINELNVESPLLIEEGVLKHSEEYKHLPLGGNKNDVLIKTETGFNWTSQNNIKADTSEYTTTSDLLNGLLDNRYYIKDIINNSLSNKSDLNHKHSEYATVSYLDKELSRVYAVIGSDNNLSNYYNKKEVDSKLSNFISSTTFLNKTLWGNIEGSLTSQIDLVNALNLKADVIHLHTDIYEPIIPIKYSAFNKNFGTTANTVAEGNHVHTTTSGTWVLMEIPLLDPSYITVQSRYKLCSDNVIEIKGKIEVNQLPYSVNNIASFPDSYKFSGSLGSLITYSFSNIGITNKPLFINLSNVSGDISITNSNDLEIGIYDFYFRYQY